MDHRSISLDKPFDRDPNVTPAKAAPATPLTTFVTSTAEGPSRKASMPSITTPFVFPSEGACSGAWSSLRLGDASGSNHSSIIYISDSGTTEAGSCQPPGWATFDPQYHYAFSPGVCPESWTYWSVRGYTFFGGRTTATCCSPGFSPSTISGYRGQMMSTVCAYTFTNRAALVEVEEGDTIQIPASVTSGVQVHQPWAITWATADFTRLPPFMTEIPKAAKLKWWDPIKEQYQELDGNGEVISTSASSSSEKSSMEKFGYAVLGSLLGVLLLLVCCMATCCRKRIVRRIKYNEGTQVESRIGGEESDIYAEILEWERRQSGRRDRTTPARNEELPLQMGGRRADSGAPSPPPPPPVREPTPPPPYVNEDSERWQTSNDNPNRRG